MKGKLLKKLCAVSLAAFMLLGIGVAEIGSFVGASVSVSAAEVTPASSFEYAENDDGGITIKKFTGSEKDVIIPDTINGKKVTNIGDSAFENCSNIKSIIISKNITSIGDWAFYQCIAIDSITIPNSVTSIGN